MQTAEHTVIVKADKSLLLLLLSSLVNYSFCLMVFLIYPTFNIRYCIFQQINIVVKLLAVYFILVFITGANFSTGNIVMD
jgi:hypothetical protein